MLVLNESFLLLPLEKVFAKEDVMQCAKALQCEIKWTGVL